MPYLYGFLSTVLSLRGGEDALQITGYGGSYAYYPYLPYMIMAAAMRFMAFFHCPPLVAARLSNVLSGTLMACLVFLIGRRALSERGALALFCIAAMFLPQGLYMHTYVNTESLCALGIAVVFYTLLVMKQDGPAIPVLLLFSLGASLVTLSYYNGYAILLISIPVYISCFYSKNTLPHWNIRRMLLSASLIIGLWAILCLWFFLRNAWLHDGDFLGLRTMQKAWLPAREQFSMRSEFDKGTGLFEMLFGARLHALTTLFVTFIACYGAVSIKAPLQVLLTFALFYLIGTIGFSFRAVHALRNRRNVDRTFLLLHPLLFLADLITFGLWLYYCYCTDFQPQGRYLMPILIHLTLFVTQGYAWLFQKIPAEKGKRVAYICVFSLLLFSFFRYFLLAARLYLA